MLERERKEKKNNFNEKEWRNKDRKNVKKERKKESAESTFAFWPRIAGARDENTLVTVFLKKN